MDKMKMINYAEKTEKFYELIETKRNEINELNISEEERNKLYSILEETVSRFEESTQNSIRSTMALIDLNESLSGLQSRTKSLKFSEN